MRIPRGFLLAVFFAGFAAQAHAASVFEQAGEKYSKGDFKAAAGLYEELARKKPTATVYFDLANAQFRLGQKGRAMANYVRAENLRPRDPDIRWNKNVLQGALQDRLEESTSFYLYPVRRLIRAVTMNEIAFLFSSLLALYTLFFLIGRIRLFAWTTPLRRFIFVLLLVCAALGVFKWADTADERVVILDREVFGRYGPSDRETKAFLLHEGALGKVKDESGAWILIALPDKTSGWIPKSAVEKI